MDPRFTDNACIPQISNLAQFISEICILHLISLNLYRKTFLPNLPIFCKRVFLEVHTHYLCTPISCAVETLFITTNTCNAHHSLHSKIPLWGTCNGKTHPPFFHLSIKVPNQEGWWSQCKLWGSSQHIELSCWFREFSFKCKKWMIERSKHSSKREWIIWISERQGKQIRFYSVHWIRLYAQTRTLLNGLSYG